MPECHFPDDRCAKMRDTIKASCRCNDKAQGQYGLDAFITRQQRGHGHGGEQVMFAFNDCSHRAGPRR